MIAWVTSSWARSPSRAVDGADLVAWANATSVPWSLSTTMWRVSSAPWASRAWRMAAVERHRFRRSSSDTFAGSTSPRSSSCWPRAEKERSVVRSADPGGDHLGHRCAALAGQHHDEPDLIDAVFLVERDDPPESRYQIECQVWVSNCALCASRPRTRASSCVSLVVTTSKRCSPQPWAAAGRTLSALTPKSLNVACASSNVGVPSREPIASVVSAAAPHPTTNLGQRPTATGPGRARPRRRR